MSGSPIITSSPVDIEDIPITEHRVVLNPSKITITQTRTPYVDIINKRTKDELISYLRDLRDAITGDDQQFGSLVTDSKKEFDILLVKVHNIVVSQLNRIYGLEKKRNYINVYINKIKNESFLARGVRKTKRRKMKKRRGSNKRNSKI